MAAADLTGQAPGRLVPVVMGHGTSPLMGPAGPAALVFLPRTAVERRARGRASALPQQLATPFAGGPPGSSAIGVPIARLARGRSSLASSYRTANARKPAAKKLCAAAGRRCALRQMGIAPSGA